MAFGNWFSDTADLSRISSAFSAIWQNLLGHWIMWLGVLPVKKREAITPWCLGIQKPPWRGRLLRKVGKNGGIGPSYTSIGCLSHFVMLKLNHSLNLILKLSSKRRGQWSCGRRDHSDIKALALPDCPSWTFILVCICSLAPGSVLVGEAHYNREENGHSTCPHPGRVELCKKKHSGRVN